MGIIDSSHRMTEGGCALISKLLLALTMLLASGASLSAQIGSEPTQLTVISSVTVGYDAVSDGPLLDFPFVLNRYEFKFLQDSSRLLIGGAGITVMLFDSLARPVDSASINLAFRSQDSAQMHRSDIRLCGTLTLTPKPGRYTARVEAIDMVSKKTGERFFRSIVVPAWDKNTFGIGRALSAWQISEVDASGEIDGDLLGNERGGFSVIANPLGIFGESDSTFSIYAEVYGLGSDSADFTLRAVLVDTLNNRREILSTRRPKPGNSAVIATSVSMADWKVGPHTLWLTVFDPGRGLSASTNIPIRKVKKQLPVLATLSAGDFRGDPYDTMSVSVREQFSSSFLAPEQMKIVSVLDDSGKIRYLDQFWRAQDMEPTTKANEKRLELISRYEYVNSNYSTLPRAGDGWRTDRGRIYMVYGPPEERDRSMFPELEWPYEIWFYYSLRKSPLFVFQDDRNNGEYKMVHSNVDGERYSSRWAQRLSRREGNRSESDRKER